MNQTQSQTSLPTVEAILSGTARGIWRTWHREGEPPIPTPEDIEDNALWDFSESDSVPEWETFLHLRAMTEHDSTDEQKDEIVNAFIVLFESIRTKNVQGVYEAWQFARETNDTLECPLVPIVKRWIVEQVSKPITREYERTHPGSVLPQKSVASVRYPLYEKIEGVSTTSITPPSAAQLILPTFERKTYLPEYLPIQIVQGLDMTGRRGVLPYPMRFFFEVGMSLKPKERQGWYCKTLYDAAVDIGIVDPEKEGKEYLTKRCKSAIANAIELLNIMRIPYQERVGGVGLYLPFRPENIPAPMSDNDFPIRVGINLPPDDNGGALVEKQIVRGLYKYLAQLNAYLAACMIFNKHGRSPHGNLINPTEPDPNTPRLESGQYVNPATDKPLFTRRGKPITDLFHPEAVDVLARVYRKEAENYPTLDEKEIMRAVYPNETWKKDGQPGRWADKAWEAWEAIAEKGYIRIESKGKGLQILPSDRHVRLHHEILKASRESQRGK